MGCRLAEGVDMC